MGNKKRRRAQTLPSAPRLIVHGITAEAWAARYGLEAFSAPCLGCGKLLTTRIPFARGTLRGLTAPKCECGEHDAREGTDILSWPPYVMVRDPKYGDLLSGEEGRLDR